MTTALLILVILAFFSVIIAYKKGDGSHKKGATIAYKTFINMMPLLIIAFTMTGLLQVIVPPEVIQSWLGEQSGINGIIIGSIGGALIPGGPYIAFPIIATIFKAGAGLGTAVAFIVGWSMWGLSAIPFELAIIGPKFFILRLGLVLIIPPLSGIIAYLLF